MVDEGDNQIAEHVAQKLRSAGLGCEIVNFVPTEPAVLRRDRIAMVLALAILTALAWSYLLWLSADMSMGGMDMTGFRMIPSGMGLMMAADMPWQAMEFAFVFAMWLVMMVGMMTPSAAPMFLMYARVGRQTEAQGTPLTPTAWFAAGYFLVWIAFALFATGIQWALERTALLDFAMASTSNVLEGLVFVAAGLYQWTRLNDLCLAQCQAPFAFLMRHGGLRGGGYHGFAAHGGSAHMGHGWSGHSFSARGMHSHGLASRGVSGRGHQFASHNLSHNQLSHNQLSHNQLSHNQLSHNQLNHNQLAHNQFAHNQFAAQNFHGLNNFSKTGFNRNAFGNNANWNHWGGRFWGAGWNNWGWGWGCWAGPVFWPFLLGDVFSFVFWPYAYYDPFWFYGPPFIFASIFAPGPYFGPDYGYGPDDYGYGYGPDYYGNVPNVYYGGGYSSHGSGPQVANTNQADREALAETNTEALQSCTGLAPGVTNLPIDQIRQTVHPTADRQAALEDLNAASSQASDVIESSCPSSVPLTPIGRLDAAEQRLDATIKVIQVVRSPLERFYQALSDEQRQRFNAMNGSTGGAPSGGNMAAACGQQGGSFIDLPVQRIEQVVQPTAQQQSAFNDLKKAAQKAGNQLQSSCPTAVPQSPVARVDTVETRLNVMADAIKSVRPDLQNFYASLSDEQKARFNTIGPPPNATSSPQHGQSGGQQ